MCRSQGASGGKKGAGPGSGPQRMLLLGGQNQIRVPTACFADTPFLLGGTGSGFSPTPGLGADARRRMFLLVGKVMVLIDAFRGLGQAEKRLVLQDLMADIDIRARGTDHSSWRLV